MRFRQRIEQFMYGRRGTDEFARFLLIMVIALIVVSWILSFVPAVSEILRLVAIAALIYCYFRILSRNIYQRQKENAWYLQKQQAAGRWLHTARDRWQQRKDYKFFRCPSCHSLLRVPKGKGKLLLTCRKCGNRFERKT